MNVLEIRDLIAVGNTLIGFDYKGRECHIDPYYIPERKIYEYLLFFDGEEQVVNTLDEVMSIPFVDGRSLTEVAGELTLTDC